MLGWGLITADLGELMAAAYQLNKSEVGKSLRDMEKREHLTFASQLPAVVRSSVTSWSPAAAQILHFSVTAALSVPPRATESNCSWHGALELSIPTFDVFQGVATQKWCVINEKKPRAAFIFQPIHIFALSYSLFNMFQHSLRPMLWHKTVQFCCYWASATKKICWIVVKMGLAPA